MTYSTCTVSFDTDYTHACICLTQWGRETHICVSTLPIIGPDNGLSSDRRQVMIWNIINEPQEQTSILIEIHTYPFKKIHFKMSSGKWWLFCLSLNVRLNKYILYSQSKIGTDGISTGLSRTYPSIWWSNKRTSSAHYISSKADIISLGYMALAMGKGEHGDKQT